MVDYRQTGSDPEFNFGEEQQNENQQQTNRQMVINKQALLNTAVSATISAGIGYAISRMGN